MPLLFPHDSALTSNPADQLLSDAPFWRVLEVQPNLAEFAKICPTFDD
jgi:hypothetical protein